MLKKIVLFMKQIGCIHSDTRYKLPIDGFRCDKKYRYVEVCQKCGSRRYIK